MQGPRGRWGEEWVLQTEPGSQEAPLTPWPCLKQTLGWEPRPLTQGCPGLLVTLRALVLARAEGRSVLAGSLADPSPHSSQAMLPPAGRMPGSPSSSLCPLSSSLLLSFLLSPPLLFFPLSPPPLLLPSPLPFPFSSPFLLSLPSPPLHPLLPLLSSSFPSSPFFPFLSLFLPLPFSPAHPSPPPPLLSPPSSPSSLSLLPSHRFPSVS